MSLEMTSRERPWAVLNCRQPDRVPIWMLYPRERYGTYVDVHNLPSYARVMPHIWERTDWLDRRNIPSGPFYTAAAGIETKVEEREGWTITRSILHTPLGDLTAEHRHDQENASGAWTEHYCKEIGDLEKVQKSLSTTTATPMPSWSASPTWARTASSPSKSRRSGTALWSRPSSALATGSAW
jgi:hypothetical protein